MEIEIGTPFLVDGKKATKFVIEPIGYVKFAEVVIAAASTQNTVLTSMMMRARTKIVLDDGKQVQLDAATLHSMPRPVAKPLVKFFDTEGDIPEDETEEAKAERLSKSASIISDGDGLTSPILIKLGTPIKAANDKEIKELEFIAKTYGDVETVLAATNDLAQTIELFKTVAKPVGLLSLPTWALDQISVRDGMFVQTKILERFLD